jgi:hypothetical protein
VSYIPDEVKIDTVQPTNPNIELWVDPNGTWATEFATKPYVDGSGWIAPTLLNSWANYGGGFVAAGYTKVGPAVYIRGTVKTGAIGSTIFTLPAGYRPSATMIFSIVSNSLFGRMDIWPDGQVVSNVGSSTAFSLTASFVADA